MSGNTDQHTGGGETYRPAWEGSQAYISYGLPFQYACLRHVEQTFNAKRVYIIASGSLSRNTGYVKLLQDKLGDKLAGTRHGMKPHTLWAEILEIAKDAKSVNADLLITLGAGSLTDGAKIIALAMANDATTFSDLDSLHADSTNPKANIIAPSIPIISIPTSLSGGEYNHRGGGTNDHNNRKYSFSHPTKGPALIMLDSELTTTTPERWWLSTGVRAVDHCVEAMCSLESTTACDEDASKGLRLLVPGLLKCKNDPSDVEARFECQLGVVEAMKPGSLHGVPMGASHGIGHQLGPLGVGHGETSCILLPAVCKFNSSVNRKQQRKVSEVLWSETDVREVIEAAGLGEQDDLGDLLDAIFRFLGMPRSLAQFGIEGEEVLGKLAENSLHDRWVPKNPRPLTEKRQLLEILEMVK